MLKSVTAQNLYGRRRTPDDVSADVHRAAARLCNSTDEDEMEELIAILQELWNEIKPVTYH
jgi:hypothetical protein